MSEVYIFQTMHMFSLLHLALFIPGCVSLYPKWTDSREVIELSGLWTFVPEKSNSEGTGFKERWYTKDLSQMTNSLRMPVPSSYNDVTQSRALRDHVGWVWYQTEFRVPKGWQQMGPIKLRFESVQYFASVFINGELAMNNTGGHLPFEGNIKSQLVFQGSNLLTVAVNNTLDRSSIPPGEFIYTKANSVFPAGWFEQKFDFDFFNYAGINRFVKLYVTPETYISDVAIETSVKDSSGILSYTISVTKFEDDAESPVPATRSPGVKVEILDSTRILVGSSSAVAGRISIPKVQLWWPRGMNETEAYLYTLKVTLLTGNDQDVYEMQFGFRTVSWTKNQFLINNKPFYFKGFGMHEDYDIRGRGFDWASMTKDMNLVEWLGANAFRTSHYPYAEERMAECDRRGIVVIDEVPAVGVRYFNNATLALHTEFLDRLVNRDRNHPSVVMWSLANEPVTNVDAARPYFKSLIDHVHSIDSTRPATIVYDTYYNTDKTADLIDIISVNRYEGWYYEMGYMDLVKPATTNELTNWYQKYHKPVLKTEYGAGSIAGMNTDPPVDFTESYQVEVSMLHHEVFDQLRPQFLIGELIWNFADFNTPQSLIRPYGCRKGVLTRARQPKMMAYVLKKRYESL